MIELLFVIHEDLLHFQCICQKVLELKPLAWLRNDSPLLKVGIHKTAEDYVDIGTWMDCPECRTRFRVTSIDYDRSDKLSGRMNAELSPTSGAESAMGARFRMLIDDDE